MDFDTTQKNAQNSAKRISVLLLFVSLSSFTGDFLHFASRFFLLKPGETEICAPSLPLCEGVLAAREEMWSEFLLSNARLYATYDSLHEQIL